MHDNENPADGITIHGVGLSATGSGVQQVATRPYSRQYFQL
jgi:hypothetical protein